VAVSSPEPIRTIMPFFDDIFLNLHKSSIVILA
jgi:hypothetical protein